MHEFFVIVAAALVSFVLLKFVLPRPGWRDRLRKGRQIRKVGRERHAIARTDPNYGWGARKA